MRAPVSIPIGGHRIRVQYVDELPAEDGTQDSGESSALGKRIRVNKSQHNSDTEIMSTVLHEMTHIALGLGGHGELLGEKGEEAVVLCIESMLAPVLSLNPSAGIRWREIAMPWEE